MRLRTSDRFVVATPDVREARLRQLLTDQLAIRWSTGEMAGEAVLMVARSPASPVARAVRSMAGQLAAAKVATFSIYAMLDPVLDPNGLLLTDFPPASGPVRMLRDSRFYEAHEQLILTGGALWNGDCLRRDPLKRDAFERCCFDIRDIADAARTYARLWASAIPVSGEAIEADASAVVPAAVLALEPGEGVLAEPHRR